MKGIIKLNFNRTVKKQQLWLAKWQLITTNNSVNNYYLSGEPI